MLGPCERTTERGERGERRERERERERDREREREREGERERERERKDLRARVFLELLMDHIAEAFLQRECNGVHALAEIIVLSESAGFRSPASIKV